MNSASLAFPPATSRLPWRIGLLAGTVAAVVEMIPVLTIQGMLGVSVTQVFQSIASGLLGRAAYAGGATTVLLGAGLHLLISLVAGILFAFAASAWLVLARRPYLSAAVYGLLVYLVMSFVVVPLSAAAFKGTGEPAMMAMSLGVHILAFALPITIVCRRGLERRG